MWIQVTKQYTVSDELGGEQLNLGFNVYQKQYKQKWSILDQAISDETLILKKDNDNDAKYCKLIEKVVTMMAIIPDKSNPQNGSRLIDINYCTRENGVTSWEAANRIYSLTGKYSVYQIT